MRRQPIKLHWSAPVADDVVSKSGQALLESPLLLYPPLIWKTEGCTVQPPPSSASGLEAHPVA